MNAAQRERFLLRVKAFWLLCRYYGHAIVMRSPGLAPMLLFSLSLLVLAAILWLNLQRADLNFVSPVWGHRVLQVKGVLSQSRTMPDGSTVQTVVSGGVVESGGFRTVSDACGAYSLTLLSPMRESVPIIFRYEGKEFVERVSFPEDSSKINRDFVFK